MIVGGGERVTLRRVAEHADACNLVSYGGDLLSGAAAVDDIRRKLAVLDVHCAAIGRPGDTVLRTYQTGWLILVSNEAGLRAKLAYYFPAGLDQRYTGRWSNFVVAGTPDQVIPHYRALVDAGIQYIIAETLDADDHETMHLLAEQVVPALTRRPAVASNADSEAQ